MKLSFKTGSILALVVASGFAGCLKDEDFDDQKYGIEIDEVKAVAFTQAADSVVLGAIPSTTEPSVVQGPLITLEHNGAASSDVAITLVEAPELVTRHGYEPLPAGSYTVSTLAPVIEAGTKSTDEVKVTIANSTTLDPTLTYGIGFGISTVSAGYQIPANQKYVVIAFSIKNRYDGVYTLRMRMEGWEAFSIATGVSDEFGEIDFLTSSANTVTMFSPQLNDNRQPGWSGTPGNITGITVFGAAAPEYVFDNATNKLIAVNNLIPDDGRGRVFELNPLVTDSRFDPDTRNLYLSYILKQTGRPNLVIYDTLLFKEDRP